MHSRRIYTVCRHRATLWALLAGTLGMTVSGCCARRAAQIRLERPTTGGLIFNPEWNVAESVLNARNDWPTASGPSRFAEGTEFREFVVDRQGRFGQNADFYYRRYESVRTGQDRR